jgi:hypothetical protein
MTTMKKISWKTLFGQLAAVSALAFCAWGQPVTVPGGEGTQFELTPYVAFGGLDGDVTIRGRTASLSASPVDVLKTLQFGFMGRTRVTFRNWFVGADGSFIGLGGANDIADLGIDEVILEANTGYRVSRFLEVLGGMRYNSLSTDGYFRGPQATSVAGEQDWWDPFLGGRVIIPLGSAVSFSSRLDVGGIGAGSRIAVNCEPLVNIRVLERATLHAGWKFYYADYKKESANFRYDMLTHGPMLGATLRW